MYDVTEAMNILEKHFAEENIDFTKEHLEHVIEYTFSFEHSKSVFQIKIDIDHVDDIILVYSIIYKVKNKKINKDKISGLSKYTISVNNILKYGQVLYDIKHQIFVYKTTTLIFRSEDIVAILYNGLKIIVYTTSILYSVIDRMITKSVDVRAAFALTQQLLEANSKE
jgi:hypothetical protein